MHYTIRNAVSLAALVIFASFSIQAHDTPPDLVSLSFKNGSLENVLKEIRRQTGYLFALQDQWKEKAKPINIQVEQAPLDDALGLIFKNQPFTYVILGKTIVVKGKEEAIPSATPIGAPGYTVRGQVLNEAGEELSGANVTIKESGKGTVTNARGEFVLSDVSLNNTLIISFIGYAAQRVIIKDAASTNLKIYLNLAKNELDKAVIQAYGKTTQRLSTADIGTIRAEDIAKQPVMNVLDVVQGQIPGVIVTNISGYTSGSKAVEIRGRNTLSANLPSNPLYIIDGVPLTVNIISNTSSYGTGAPGFVQSGISPYAGGQDPLFSINPSDIESVQVLKDADATAIYGSRGSNGVILITTKSGKAGKTHFELEASQGAAVIARTYPLLNTSQYNAMRREALDNDGIPVNATFAPDLVLGDSTRSTNWQKFLWGRTGKVAKIDASLTGGTILTSFRISAGYSYERDLTDVSGGNSVASVNLNLRHSMLDKRLELSLAALYTYVLTNQIGISGAPNMVPDAPPVFDKNGNLNFAAWDNFYGGYNFPFGTLLQPYTAGTNLLTGSLMLKYEIAKGLVFRTSLGYNNSVASQLSTQPLASFDPAFNPTGSVSIGTSLNHNIIVEPQVEYSNFIGKGKFNFLIGATHQDNVTSASLIQASGIENDALLQDISAAPPTSRVDNYNLAEYKYAGVFGRINYNLGDKYIVNLNARRDGSSRFGPGRQYGNFGSAAFAWIFTEENWVKRHVGALSFGKLRASYGTTGGDEIGNYQYMTQWTFGSYTYNGNLPLIPLKHTDSTFHWNLDKKFEVALELGFLKDRFTTSGTFYLNRHTEELVQYPTPAFTGFSFVFTNSPADIQNSGWEYIINAKIVDQKDLSFAIRFNIGRNYNKLVAFPNLDQSPYATTFEIGKPLTSRWLLHSTGVDPATGEYAFKDKNHDGQIISDPGRPDDDSYFYDLSPKFDGGVSLNFKYKNAELSAFFYMRSQMGVKPTASLDIPGDMSNQPLEVFQHHWQKVGDVAQFAKFTANPTDNSYSNYFYYSDGVFTNIFFTRLQNVFFSYGLPTSKWRVKGIKDARFTIRAQNLFVLTNYKGSDPEIQSFNVIPIPRKLTFGISANF